MRKSEYIIGIDEVGRGPLAGPVVVVAVAAHVSFFKEISKLPVRLRDSKKLSEKDRLWWVKYIKIAPKIAYAAGRIYPKNIDRMNIARAANRAALRAYIRLTRELRAHNPTVFLDGGLYLGSKAYQKKMPRTRTVVRGDQKIPAVALASIIAKVSRDRYMARLAKKYPKYGFEIHKGYGTRAHLSALQKYGRTSAHRLTFLKNYPTIR